MDQKQTDKERSSRARTEKEVLAEDVLDIENVVSATECTGLMPTPPHDEAEVESYTQLYDIPQPRGKVDNGLQQEKINRS